MASANQTLHTGRGESRHDQVFSQHAKLNRDFERLVERVETTQHAIVVLSGKEGTGKAHAARQICDLLFGQAPFELECRGLTTRRLLMDALRQTLGTPVALRHLDQASASLVATLDDFLPESRAFPIFILTEDPDNLWISLSKLTQQTTPLFTLHLPTLGERAEDILPLARRFLGPRFVLSAHAAHRLREHAWVGQIAELRRVMECLVATFPEGPTAVSIDDHTLRDTLALLRIRPDLMQLPELTGDPRLLDFAHRCGLPKAVEIFEAAMIARTMQGCSGSLTLSSKQLRVPISTLASKIRNLRESINDVSRWLKLVEGQERRTLGPNPRRPRGDS